MNNPKISTIKNLLSRMPEGGNKFTDSINELVAAVANAAEHISMLQTEPDPMLSQLAIDGQILREREALRGIIGTVQKHINALIEEERGKLHARNIEDAKLIPNEHAQEIRSIFRGLSAQEKHAFLKNAIDKNEASTLAAITEFPNVLTGMAQEQLTGYREAFLNKTRLQGGYQFLTDTSSTVDVILEAAATV